jgi:hypothetical protein
MTGCYLEPLEPSKCLHTLQRSIVLGSHRVHW